MPETKRVNVSFVYTDNIDLPEELNYVVVGSATSQSHQAGNMAKKLQEAHTRAGMRFS